MRALSIKQPWVHAILYEGKDIENRSWQCKFRGWIALHASAKPSPDYEFPRGHRCPDLSELDYSAICGVARLIAIVEKSRSKWFQRPVDGSVNYGWVLADVRALKQPIPCSGARSLWTVPPAFVRKIRAQLPSMKFENE
jgi:hypothetical protein